MSIKRHRVHVGTKVFKASLAVGQYEYWSPFKDVYSLRDEIELVERPLNTSVDAICVDVRWHKDGWWVFVFGLPCGTIQL